MKSFSFRRTWLISIHPIGGFHDPLTALDP